MEYRAGDAFGRPCVSYGGVIADRIHLPGGELESDLDELYDSAFDDISETDRLSIEGYPEDEWAPLRLALEVLYLRRREAVVYARQLVAKFWANEAA